MTLSLKPKKKIFCGIVEGQLKGGGWGGAGERGGERTGKGNGTAELK